MKDTEEFNSIKLELAYIDEQGVHSSKIFTIKVGTIKHLEKNAILFGRAKEYTYEMNFSLVMPNHIHAGLIGQSVPDNFGGRDTRVIPMNLSKTISYASIGGLTKEWQNRISEYAYLLGLKNMKLHKIIMYRFEGDVSKSRSFFRFWQDAIQ